MKKKIISLTLVMLTILAFFPSTAFAQWAILDPSKASGSNYTLSEPLAKAFDAVFAGDIDVYKEIGCINEQSMPLGYSMNTSQQFFSKSKANGVVYSGWQCYIYATAVYNKLFGEFPYYATNLHHSSIVMKGSGGKNTVSYQEFVNAGIRSGAYIRTTPRSDNSYYGNDGHSMVLLYYDEGGIVYIEGNADGRGLVRIFNQTWAEFNNTELKGVKRYLCHIIQANDEYYEKHYPENVEEKKYISQCTFYPSSYTIKAIATANLRNMPCNSNTNAASKILVSLDKGTTLTATGVLKNTEGNYWYRVLYNGNTYYLYAKNTEAVSIKSDAKITGAKYPTQIIKGDSFTLEGVVSSQYVTLLKVQGFIYSGNSQVYTKSASVTNNKFSIKSSAIDSAMLFGKLAAGKYKYVLMADVESYFVDSSQKLQKTGLCVTLLNKEFTVHVHNFVHSGYELAHPHREVKRCSCGAEQYGSENYTVKTVTTNPTCGSAGKTEKICTTCNKVISSKPIAALDHMNIVVNTTPKTCTTNGKEETKCLDCNKVISTVVLEAVGHIEMIVNKKDPTPTSAGYTGDVVCYVCGAEIRKGEIIMPEYLLGDVNLDGVVNALDATQILRYSNSKQSTFSAADDATLALLKKIGDVNLDGTVNALDATQILRYANGKSSVLTK